VTARRALPEPPTALQRLAARITQGQRHDSLVSALEDHADRLDGYARRTSTHGDELVSKVYALCADEHPKHPPGVLVSSRTQLTPAEIEEIRDAHLDGVGVHELAARYRRSTTTISKVTFDLRVQPEMPPLEVAPDNPDAQKWTQRAACRWSDVDTFFPGEDNKPGIEFAQRICAACPVTVPCLQEAMDTGSLGIWAGTTERQRNGMRARARRAAIA
jgi:WhiB family redox-sensing transcriptional regulator